MNQRQGGLKGNLSLPIPNKCDLSVRSDVAYLREIAVVPTVPEDPSPVHLRDRVNVFNGSWPSESIPLIGPSRNVSNPNLVPLVLDPALAPSLFRLMNIPGSIIMDPSREKGLFDDRNKPAS